MPRPGRRKLPALVQCIAPELHFASSFPNGPHQEFIRAAGLPVTALSAQILPLTTRLLAGECSPRQRTTQVKLSTSIILPAESAGKLIQLTSKVWDKRGRHAFWALPRMEKTGNPVLRLGALWFGRHTHFGKGRGIQC